MIGCGSAYIYIITYIADISFLAHHPQLMCSKNAKNNIFRDKDSQSQNHNKKTHKKLRLSTGLSITCPDPTISTHNCLIQEVVRSIGYGSPALGLNVVSSSGGLAIWETDELNPLEELVSPYLKSRVLAKNLVSPNSNSANIRWSQSDLDRSSQISTRSL